MALKWRKCGRTTGATRRCATFGAVVAAVREQSAECAKSFLPQRHKERGANTNRQEAKRSRERQAIRYVLMWIVMAAFNIPV
ncbi:MAG: hypothetical protein LCI00_05860 [Chloroflexi bacterium]|nr:hypothetical protein [Chloroflexota bacterium]MCC6896521.1 hypothetical protein [Anaerolineae bacterium]